MWSPRTSPPTDRTRNIEDDLMVKFFPNICHLHLVKKLTNSDKPNATMYTNEATEHNACFAKLKHIAEGTDAEVFMDEFNICLNFAQPGRSYIILACTKG